MESKVEKLKNNKVRLTITVSPKEMKKYFDTAYSQIAPTVKLDGFRPGKAPKALVESTVGVTRILSEAFDLAVNENYIEALEKNEIHPISQPAIKINKYPQYGETEEQIKNDLEFEAEITVFPEVKVGDYSKVKIEKPAKEKSRPEDVDKILDNLRKQKASFLDIDRVAEKGDFAEITFEGSLKGVKIDAMASKNHPIVIGENTLIPGFEDHLVGMKKAESKEFKIKFPKDYHSKEYAGKEADFKVELVNLRAVKLPEIDDAFAAEFGHKNPVELKSAIEKNIAEEIDHKYQAELESRIIDKVLPFVKADIPAEMIDRELERMTEGYKEQLKGMGVNFDSYLTSTKKTAEDLQKEMRPTAEKNVKVGMLLGQIVEELKIEQDPEAGKKALNHLVETLAK